MLILSQANHALGSMMRFLNKFEFSAERKVSS